MRIGNNPQRDKLVNVGNFNHQIIMPVYIPNLDEYYMQSFEVFKISIQSLIKTVHSQTYITIIPNGCCIEVEKYLTELLESKKIHELIITGPIGKVNAILKGLAGSLYSLVTITDADVLFLNDWQNQTYQVFNNFPKCGVVSPVPNPSLAFFKNLGLFIENLFNKNLVFDKVKNVDALIKFAISIDNYDNFKKHFEKVIIIKNKNFNAVVGAGHFIATYKADIFDHNFIRKTKYALGGYSENNLLDQKALDLGLWRLSTENNYAFHMGNVLEQWHIDYYNQISDQSTEDISILKFPIIGLNKTSKFKIIYFKSISRIFYSTKIKNLILKIISKRSKV